MGKRRGGIFPGSSDCSHSFLPIEEQRLPGSLNWGEGAVRAHLRAQGALGAARPPCKRAVCEISWFREDILREAPRSWIQVPFCSLTLFTNKADFDLSSGCCLIFQWPLQLGGEDKCVLVVPLEYQHLPPGLTSLRMGMGSPLAHTVALCLAQRRHSEFFFKH